MRTLRSSPFRVAHLWLGWVLAGWLLVMALSGTLLLWKPQIRALTAPACAKGAWRPLADALRTIDRTFPGRVRLVVPASSELCLHEVIFRADVGGAYLDPATLKVAQVWGPHGRPTDLLLEMHRHLLLRGDRKLPTSILAAATLLLTALGVIVALGRGGALSLRVWPLARTPGALAAAHRNLGVLLAVPLMFMAASGWAMSYPEAATRLLARVLGDRPQARPAMPASELGPIDWDAVLAGGQSSFPGLKPRVVTWPSKPGAPLVLRFRQAGEWSLKGQSSASVDAVGGRILAVTDARRAAPSARIFGTLHPLHSGHVPNQIGIVFVAAVGVSTALSLGVAVWANTLRTLRRRSRSAGRRRALDASENDSPSL